MTRAPDRATAAEYVRRSQQRKRDAGYVRKYVMLSPEAAAIADGMQIRSGLSFSALIDHILVFGGTARHRY